MRVWFFNYMRVWFFLNDMRVCHDICEYVVVLCEYVLNNFMRVWIHFSSEYGCQTLHASMLSLFSAMRVWQNLFFPCEYLLFIIPCEYVSLIVSCEYENIVFMRVWKNLLCMRVWFCIPYILCMYLVCFSCVPRLV